MSNFEIFDHVAEVFYSRFYGEITEAERLLQEVDAKLGPNPYDTQAQRIADTVGQAVTETLNSEPASVVETATHTTADEGDKAAQMAEVSTLEATRQRRITDREQYQRIAQARQLAEAAHVDALVEPPTVEAA